MHFKVLLEDLIEALKFWQFALVVLDEICLFTFTISVLGDRTKLIYFDLIQFG